jgi:hypothetical protein
MRFTAHSLRSLLPVLAIAALAALTTNSASAQSRMNVPFSFTAGGQNCPAGIYILQASHWGSVVTLSGAGHGLTLLVGPGDPAPDDKRVMLTFDRMGNNFALRTVQYKSQITARLDKKFKERIPAAQQIAMLSQVTISAGQE